MNHNEKNEALSSDGLSRRRFIQRASMVAGGGLLLGFNVVTRGAQTNTPSVSGTTFSPNAFIRIAPDDTVTLIMPSVEMGQGVYTSMSMMLAEELDIDFARVKTEHAPPDQEHYGNPIYIEQLTGGSTTTMGWYMPLRKAGASARYMLMSAAAGQWKVEAATLRTHDGMVVHDATGRSVRYGALVDQASTVKPPATPTLKDEATFRYIGKPVRRIDTPDKVNGKTQYGIDVMLPGMKFATLKSSPVFGGKVAQVDDSKALKVPGVRQVVVLDDLVAVVGDHMWAAKQGLAALSIKWNDGPNANLSQSELWAALEKGAGGQGVPAKKTGDALAHLSGDGVYEATYELPFLAHAAMEPMNCTVHVRPDACDVWVGTQAIGKARDAAAAAAGLKAQQVTIHNHIIGGGFGRRLEMDGISKAVRIGKHVNGPVKVVYTREEDIQQENYRPMYHMHARAKVQDGKILAWHHRVTGPALLARWLPEFFIKNVDLDAVEGAVDMPYGIPNLYVEYVRQETPIPTSFWRGVGPNANVFATESLVEKIAHSINVDPLEFRRRMLQNNPRALAVLNLAAEKAGWSRPLPPAPQGSRVGRGIAVFSGFGSFLACVAEVIVSEDGNVSVTRTVTASDVGLIVNPDTLEAQVQGGTIFGVAAVLYGQVTIDHGRIQQSNFHDYRVLRLDETPKIETYFVHSKEKPGGIGEPGTVIVQPAIVNAVYAATGVQLTRMPISPKLLQKQATT
ncbi:molybdopterin-dependent oxidoreductase [Paraburkholderia sp. USG1]|uniref:xanthine dehydrogenase family protein molybdopterin-binding subunit n=1 Tax=Paraburkholderia sp. USG1 TaxID=2952268 RepID=UPI002854FDBC|nr:molybdopterin cofactor-binding domain-containing protein [Paraburkholderia sp. USG1]MDR8401826.1 molybdopterin-dependent oxidoreductase [Paraburkholderia sp. USG1]